MSDPSLEHPSDAPRDPRDLTADDPAAGGSSDNPRNVPDSDPVQPLRDGDTSIEPDPAADPAQVEWDLTTAVDEGADLDDLLPATATGDDPDQIPSDDDEVPAVDAHPPREFAPDSQGEDPDVVAIDEEGQGDLAPEDL